jgi:Fur family transcriptional regulator, ferric uptake regulator
MKGDPEEALASLRHEGRRVTTARRAVIELLGGTGDHLTVEDVAARVQASHPEIHLSTIYRTLESLEAWGLVKHIRRGNGAAFFHLGSEHQHLVCELCGRVYDVPEEELQAFVARVREEHGFELDIGHHALMGRCKEHAANSAAAINIME